SGRPLDSVWEFAVPKCPFRIWPAFSPGPCSRKDGTVSGSWIGYNPSFSPSLPKTGSSFRFHRRSPGYRLSPKWIYPLCSDREGPCPAHRFPVFPVHGKKALEEDVGGGGEIPSSS